MFCYLNHPDNVYHSTGTGNVMSIRPLTFFTSALIEGILLIMQQEENEIVKSPS